MTVTRTLEGVGSPDLGGRVESYRRLADVFHEVLSEQSLDALLERIADTLAEIVPYDTLTIYEADETQQILIPVLARDPLAAKILESRGHFGRGITGWAVEHRQAVLSNQAHLDPRMVNIPGTPPDPEALISVPLIASGSVKGVLNVYRVGAEASFTEEELELAKRFGDAASIALDNAQTRAALEHEAQTDSLTGLYNHRFFQERLRSELTRASRAHDSVTILMFDIDDFKKLNDVYGHATGDQILAALADILKTSVRASDVVCRIGGEEFAVIMPSNTAGDAGGLARRLTDRLAATQFEPAGEITISVGISQGPEHGMNPRELVACAEAAMMTAKARGKNRIVLYDDTSTERPDSSLYSSRRDVRSIAHMKMLQSLAGKLNRLNDVRQIGDAIANELRTLIDYHNCRVYVVEDENLELIAFRGQSVARRDQMPEAFSFKVGEGVTGRAAETARPVIVPNALECDFAVHFPDTEGVEKSIAAVPLRYGARVIGVVVISKLGTDQFDEDDVRLLEVLAGHASVALENASLYEAQRREAENAKALLEFSEIVATSPSFYAIGDETVDMVARLLNAPQVGLWLGNERASHFTCAAHAGYAGDRDAVEIIRRRIEKDVAESFLDGHKGPFTLSPEEAVRVFEVDAATATSVAIAPLPKGDGLSGWIAVTEPPSKGQLHFTEDRLRLLAGLANQATNAMQKALLYKYQKEEAEIANASLEFSRQLATAEDLHQVVSRTVELAARILGSPKTGLWLQELETGDVVAEALWGGDEADRHDYFAARFGADAIRPLLAAEDPFIMKPADYVDMAGVQSLAKDALVAVAPLRLEGGRLGCIVVEAPAFGDYEFSERKVRLLTGVAHQASLAIDNACSYENLERTFLSTVESLANALEAKDEYTSSHARSITDMALEVGTELGMDSKGLKRLELGALFHDIGKIGIPSQILLKPGPLTDEEREIIETHPELGEKILAPIARLEDVRPIVRHCHEHFDGSGYPDRKVAEDIPIESRVILVCDAFHAMTTDRPYRKRLPVEEACSRLERSAGKQFDPEIVEVFLRLMRDNPGWAEGA